MPATQRHCLGQQRTGWQHRVLHCLLAGFIKLVHCLHWAEYCLCTLISLPTPPTELVCLSAPLQSCPCDDYKSSNLLPSTLGRSDATKVRFSEHRNAATMLQFPLLLLLLLLLPLLTLCCSTPAVAHLCIVACLFSACVSIETASHVFDLHFKVLHAALLHTLP